MKKAFADIYQGIMGSFHNGSEGWSGKKLTAWSIVVCVIVAHIQWVRHQMPDFISVLVTDFGFICTLYGINVTDKKLNQTKDSVPTTSAQ